MGNEDDRDPLADDPVGRARRTRELDSGHVGKSRGDRTPIDDEKPAQPTTQKDDPNNRISGDDAVGRTWRSFASDRYRPIVPDDEDETPTSFADMIAAKSSDKGGESTRRGREDAHRKNSDRQEEFREQRKIDKFDEKAGQNIDRTQKDQARKPWWR